MRNLIIAALVCFLLYSNSSFRTYTLKGLQSITNFIKELPNEKEIEEEIKIEEDSPNQSGISTY